MFSKKGAGLVGIALDESNGMIYASDYVNHVIWRMTIEGKDQQILTGQKSKEESDNIADSTESFSKRNCRM